MNGGDSSAKDGGDGVARSIEDHDDGVDVCDGSKPVRISEGKWSEQKQDEISHDQPCEPLAELKSGHRIPGIFCAESAHRGVIYGEKAGGGFVDDVSDKREAERDPSVAEIAGPDGFKRSRQRLKIPGYSYRSATMGSTRVARRAGT